MLKVTKTTFDGQHIEYETESGVKYYDPNVEARAVAKAQAREAEKARYMQQMIDDSIAHTKITGVGCGIDVPYLAFILCVVFSVFTLGVILWFWFANFWFFLGAIAIDAIFFGILIIKVLFD